ncbi:hypothetical protein HC891_24950 [Candidatus Gracilibacteria bacterium]|nr:hypothetical protein [Candidatus Gracilibacteria bacterium]
MRLSGCCLSQIDREAGLACAAWAGNTDQAAALISEAEQQQLTLAPSPNQGLGRGRECMSLARNSDRNWPLARQFHDDASIV